MRTPNSLKRIIKRFIQLGYDPEYAEALAIKTYCTQNTRADQQFCGSHTPASYFPNSGGQIRKKANQPLKVLFIMPRKISGYDYVIYEFMNMNQVFLYILQGPTKTQKTLIWGGYSPHSWGQGTLPSKILDSSPDYYYIIQKHQDLRYLRKWDLT